MSKALLFLLLGLSLFACDKVKKAEKDITGVWTIYQYKITLGNGLVYYYPANGTMDFGSCGGGTCNYALRVNYLKDTLDSQKYEDGTIDIKDDLNFTLDRNNPDGSITHLDYGRFLLITKDDIKIHFRDASGLHEFVLQK